MSRGCVQRIARGLVDEANVYILLKNGSVWLLSRKVKTDREMRELRERIAANGGYMPLDGWFRVRKAPNPS